MFGHTTRAERREFARENAKRPVVLERCPPEVMARWPNMPASLIEVWQSRAFLVQVHKAPAPAHARLTINRTMPGPDGRWEQDITWDDLQRIKNEVGFALYDAVEVYPRKGDVVNVANMRHLWIMPELLPFAWRPNKSQG